MQLCTMPAELLVLFLYQLHDFQVFGLVLQYTAVTYLLTNSIARRPAVTE